MKEWVLAVALMAAAALGRLAEVMKKRSKSRQSDSSSKRRRAGTKLLRQTLIERGREVRSTY
jgi:hypothetical protein